MSQLHAHTLKIIGVSGGGRWYESKMLMEIEAFCKWRRQEEFHTCNTTIIIQFSKSIEENYICDMLRILKWVVVKIAEGEKVRSSLENLESFFFTTICATLVYNSIQESVRHGC